MRRWLVFALLSFVPLLAVAALGALAPAGAEEDPLTLEVRVHPVGALTQGRWSYVREVAGPVFPESVSDEARPLFGRTLWEPELPFGTVDELIELVRAAVEPMFWETQPGAELVAPDEVQLLVRATPAVHAKVEAFLDGLQEAAGRMATVELRWIGVAPEAAAALFAGDDALLLDDGRLQDLLAGADEGPALSVSCFSGQQAAAFGGRQAAWVQDADVEVAQESTTTDPIVGVVNLGFAAQVRPVLAKETVLVGIDAALAEMGDRRIVPTNRNARLEAPVFPVVSVRPVLRLPYAAWAVAEGRRLGEDGPVWLLMVRVTAHAYDAGEGPGASVNLSTALRTREGPTELRTFDLSDLTVPVGHRVGEPVFLWPSNFTPSEPPEMPEPSAAHDIDGIVDLVRMLSEGETWEDPASIEGRSGLLFARNAPPVLDALEDRLERIRDGALWTLVTTAEVVEVERELAGRVASGAVLEDAVLRELAAAKEAGRARVVDTLRLTNFRHARNVVRAGEEVTYLQDFEVEIAQAAEIGNPVVRNVFAGAQLDLRAARARDGRSVQLSVEFIRTDLERPLHTHATTQGDVELPRLDVFRLRTGLQAPLGKTVLAGSWCEDDRCRLLLLTPRLR